MLSSPPPNKPKASPAKASSAKPPKASAKTSKAHAKSSEEDSGAIQDSATKSDLPSVQEVALLFEPLKEFIANPLYARVRSFIKYLLVKPPQVLLFEGGDVQTRLAASHYWALSLNCLHLAANPQADANHVANNQAINNASEANQEMDNYIGEPCLECKECLRFISHLHRDCFFFDGTLESIKIEPVRELLSVLGELPRDAHFRMVIFREAQFLGEAAANALLKSLEEPRPRTCFVLIAPQRERLLPTLVSRSMTLTLPWPDATVAEENAELVRWEAELSIFLESGRGLFGMTASKGAVDAARANLVLNHCAKALALHLRNGAESGSFKEGLSLFLDRLPTSRLRILDEVLGECQDSLTFGVNPALVLEWFATRFYLLLPH